MIDIKKDRNRYTIRLTVPAPLYRFRYSNWKKYIKAKLNPIKCESCGVEMPFRNAQIASKNPYLTVTKCSGKTCRKCMVDEIKLILEQGAHEDDYDKGEPCAICKKDVKSYRGIYRAVPRPGINHESLHRYYHCTNAWNSDYVCPECIIGVIENGQEESSFREHVNGKSYSINEQGLPVVDGKPRFPKS